MITELYSGILYADNITYFATGFEMLYGLNGQLFIVIVWNDATLTLTVATFATRVIDVIACEGRVIKASS